ncbi:MAG: hypothetical protein M0042_12090 [Nitrospiraceae bacterium]|nr:hypothetical protein [Nitrospiraceae bacterium]
MHNVYAYDAESTHRDITIRATDVNVSYLSFYLKNALLLSDGLSTEIKLDGIDKSIRDWLWTGSVNEDAIVCRRSTHFHNPLMAWGKSGLGEITPFIFCGSYQAKYTGSQYSVLTWATGLESKTGSQIVRADQDMGWDHARSYYHRFLTMQTGTARNINAVFSFQALGQVLHLLQDMAVPAHVRNDFFNSHLWNGNTYENYASKQEILNNIITITPKGPQVSYSEVYPTDFWDTSSETIDVPSQIDNIAAQSRAGLAEYTNANFLSDGTSFSSQSFSYPQKSSTVEKVYSVEDPFHPGSTVKRPYFYKDSKSEWENNYLLAAKSVTLFYKPESGAISPDVIIPIFDDRVNEDYANRLLPRAVGYSAALIDYFFRGDINLTIDDSDPSRFLIKNNINEGMSGQFSLYYDDESGNRLGLGKWPGDTGGTMNVPAKGTSSPITFDEPLTGMPKPKDPGTYILAFKGDMGNEKKSETSIGAVVGRVMKFPQIQISPPGRCMYGIADGAAKTPEFAKLKAKVSSPNLAASNLQSATLWAVARYRERVDYAKDLTKDPPEPASLGQTISYASSVPIPLEAAQLEGLIKGQKEMTFEFKSKPIPAGITDLYLRVVIKGYDKEGKEIIAMGTRDLSEPTHNIFTNDTDLFLYGSLDAAFKLMTKDQVEAMKTTDEPAYNAIIESQIAYWPYAVKYELAFCPQEIYPMPPTKYDVVYESLGAGEFGRALTIADRSATTLPITAHKLTLDPLVKRYGETLTSTTTTMAINQEFDKTFQSTAPVDMRGLEYHYGSGFMEAYPSRAATFTPEQLDNLFTSLEGFKLTGKETVPISTIDE